MNADPLISCRPVLRNTNASLIVGHISAWPHWAVSPLVDKGKLLIIQPMLRSLTVIGALEGHPLHQG